VRTLGLRDQAAAWYAANDPAFRANLDAFAAGITAYGRTHADTLDDQAELVLPIAGVDVVTYSALGTFFFLAEEGGCPLGEEADHAPAGSNGWAIAPSRAANGHALLLANPHLPWVPHFAFFEAQLSIPGAYQAYGVAHIGLPYLSWAFTDRLGWTLTVNTIDACDLYALTSAEGGYRFDGKVRPFETRTERIQVRQADGMLREETLTVRRSVHGPVLEHHGALFALRMAGFEGNTSLAGMDKAWWDLGRAQNLDEFEAVLARLQIPFGTVIYADADGHIMSLFNGLVPKRPAGVEDWSEIIPGDTSATLWTEVHSYEDLPKVVDPPSGWVQNGNSPPWYTTYPLQLDPADYPPYMAPQHLFWRERRGIRMLTEDPSITFEELVDDVFSSRMELADRILEELIAAARRSEDATAARAANVLAAWDRQATPDSTGTLLFLTWITVLQSEHPSSRLDPDLFATPADPAAPLTTPDGLAAPEAAVRALVTAAHRVEAAFGRLDVPWGEVVRLRIGEFDEPASGARGDPAGSFRDLRADVAHARAGRPVPAIGGDTFIAVVEFAEPVRAAVLLTYGNASKPGSPHVGDQLVLYARDELRPAWLTRSEIEANLEALEVLAPAA
jgi:acyl-homoserine-lactone acylase